MEEIFKKLEWDGMGLKIDEEYLNNLTFADDIVFLNNLGKDLEKMMKDLHRENLKVGLKMNMKKTKIMFDNHLV